MPTVQITSALISALQVQEAIKLLHNQQTRGRKENNFQRHHQRLLVCYIAGTGRLSGAWTLRQDT
jgi:hypothetical protein